MTSARLLWIRPGSDSAFRQRAAGAALADGQPFLRVEPIDPGALPFASEQDEQSSIAKPAVLTCQLAQACPQSRVPRPAEPIADYRAICGNPGYIGPLPKGPDRPARSNIPASARAGGSLSSRRGQANAALVALGCLPVTHRRLAISKAIQTIATNPTGIFSAVKLINSAQAGRKRSNSAAVSPLRRLIRMRNAIGTASAARSYMNKYGVTSSAPPGTPAAFRSNGARERHSSTMAAITPAANMPCTVQPRLSLPPSMRTSA